MEVTEGPTIVNDCGLVVTPLVASVTVTLAVPAVVSSDPGTVAVMDVALGVPTTVRAVVVVPVPPVTDQLTIGVVNSVKLVPVSTILKAAELMVAVFGARLVTVGVGRMENVWVAVPLVTPTLMLKVEDPPLVSKVAGTVAVS